MIQVSMGVSKSVTILNKQQPNEDSNFKCVV